MSIIKDFLNDNETLFTPNVEALDFDYIPKLVPYREKEQRTIASCIKPLYQKRNGRNIVVHGAPGVGKTVAIKHLLKEMEEESDEVFPIYINCWKLNTSYKIFLGVCEQLNYKFTQNKKTEELSSVAQQIINKNAGAALVFDEIDKVEDHTFLYTILEEIYRKSIIMVTNYPDYVSSFDQRIKSRLIPDKLEFKEYNEHETKEILKQRMKYAFIPNVWEDEAFNMIAKKTYEIKDIRTGLFLMKEAGQYAEDNSKSKIDKEDVNHALSKLNEFSSKDTLDLGETEQRILEMIKENSGEKIGELFKKYTADGTDMSYKTFQRKIKKLEDNNFITSKKIQGGKEGKTSVIEYGSVKKLTDF